MWKMAHSIAITLAVGLMLFSERVPAQSIVAGTPGTLDVAAWNIQTFGHPGFGPENDSLQLSLAAWAINSADIDLWAVQEMTDSSCVSSRPDQPCFQTLVDSLDGYEGVFASIVGPTGLGRVGFIYKSSVITPVSVYHILVDEQDEFGDRAPLVMEADVSIGGNTERIVFISLHMEPGLRDINIRRRRNAGRLLKAYIETELMNEKVVALGDFNDELLKGKVLGGPSSYEHWVADSAGHRWLTLELEKQGILLSDHIVVNSELEPKYIEGTASKFDSLVQAIPQFYTRASDHPPIIARFHPANSIPFRVLNPVAGSEIAGDYKLNWSFGAPVGDVTTTIEYRMNEEDEWHLLARVTSGDSAYTWNTRDVPDGTRYRLRMIVEGDSTFAVSKSEGMFTIDNPGNAVPDVVLDRLQRARPVSGEQRLTWSTADADGDTLSVAIDYSVDGGDSWKLLAGGLPGTGEYMWNSPRSPNSPFFRLLLRAADGTVVGTDTSAVFQLFNMRSALPPDVIEHVAGPSTATLSLNVVDRSKFDNTLYRVTFEDSLAGEKSYSIRNVDNGELVVRGAMELDGVTEGPEVGGVRLLIEDIEQAEFNEKGSRWRGHTVTLTPEVSLPVLQIGNETLTAFAYPADYRFIIFDQIVDTSSTEFGATAQPMRFLVENVTDGRPVDIIYIDGDGNQSLSGGDDIFILEPDPDQGGVQLTWELVFNFPSGDSVRALPGPGEEFYFATFKPLSSRDVYEFRNLTVGVSAGQAGTVPRELTLYPNYPNPFNPSTTIQYDLPQAGHVRLVIVNLLGQEVATLVDGHREAGPHVLQWNGTTSQGVQVGSGVYFYRIEAGDRAIVRKMVMVR